MRPHAVGVRHDRRESTRLAVVGLDAATPLAGVGQDALRRRVSVRNSTPSSSASFTSASGTARVPPRGYQMPSLRLHVGDAAQHRRRLLGARADVLREVVEHLGDARVAA